MGAFTRLAGRLAVLAAAILPAALPASAQTPADSGTYVADVREAAPELGLSSSIELRPDGRFDWRFTMQGLALSARGEWERDGNMIRISNPDQVGQPEIALASSSRDATATLRVQLDSATARMASALQAELEFPDNYFARAPFEAGEVRIPAGEQRPIAVRLTSEQLTFRTQPIAIAPDGDNVLKLRLVPADLGQAFFASQSMPFDGGGMTLDWGGYAIRYNRAPTRPGGN